MAVMMIVKFALWISKDYNVWNTKNIDTKMSLAATLKPGPLFTKW